LLILLVAYFTASELAMKLEALACVYTQLASKPIYINKSL
jgi:hypothetical protein